MRLSGKRRSEQRWVISAVLLALILSACAGPTGRRVGLKSFAADLVFGIPPLEEPVAPPDTFPSDLPVTEAGPPTRGFGDMRAPVPAGPSGRACPEAETNEVEEEAGDKVQSMPQAGKYRWVQSGFQSLPAPVGKLPVPQFATRNITNIRPGATRGDFRFTMTQTEVGSGEVVAQTFDVITSRPDPRTGPNIIRDEGTTNGIFLVQIRRGEGRNASTFTPNPPVLYLPLPVIIGFERTTQASDPTTLQLLTHRIHVKPRQRWDACGEMVDGWFVDAHQTFSGPQGTTPRDYNYGIATQYGGIIVFEHVESPCNTYDAQAQSCVPEGNIKYDSHIGQIRPDPLDEGG